MLAREFDFLGLRRVFLVISVVLVLVSAGALAVRGLTFGIEFQGGTVVTFDRTEGIEIGDVRAAFAEAGEADVQVQTAENGGFIVRMVQDDPDVANTVFRDVAATLGISEADGNVSTIGPGWGRNITRSALLALIISIAAILLYVSLRYEYKMSLTAVFTLAHDMLLVLGIYALVGREVTPSTIAALLTIMGYSLYDTIVVFHRIKENAKGLTRTTFTKMANHSLNQVFARSINTSVTSTMPPLMLLIFGGETLGGFAFALVVGVFIGAYSSIAVATPLFVLWKEHEPKFQALAKKYGAAA